MAAQKLQVEKVLRVIPSDNALIPFPAIRESGVTTSTSTNKLIDSSANFLIQEAKVGDIVYNLTDETAATVIAVDSNTALTLNANIMTSGKTYILYQGGNNNGCVLYIGGAGDINVLTSGNTTGAFDDYAASNFFPVSVLQVFETGTSATLINALW